MSKINFELWEQTEESGQGFPKIKRGIYLCRILGLQDMEEKELLKIKFDIVTGYELVNGKLVSNTQFANHFTEQEKVFKEYPNSGILWKSYKTAAYPFLKALVTALEKSNNGYNFKATNGDFQSFIGKQFIGVFGDEEIPFPDDNGIPKIDCRLQDVRSTQALGEGKIVVSQTVKKLSGTQLDKFQQELLNDKIVAERKAESQPTPTPVIPKEPLPF